MVKTTRGFICKETTGDGRESVSKWVEREQFLKKQTKTKKKRAKKADKELKYMVNNL